jgi:hypothetical protein
MNVALSQPATGEAVQGVQNARYSPAGAAPAPLTPSGAGDAAGVTAYFQSASPASHTGLQTAASYAQTASGYVGQVGELLQQMAGLSSQARNGTAEARAGAASGFEAAQKELRTIVGGTSDEVGGSTSQGAVFGGSDLFGASSGSATVATGLSSQPSITLGGSGLNLRQGAVLSLISQDASGSFELGAADPGTPQAISGAVQQVSVATAAVNRTQAMVDVASAEVQVGEENLASAVFTPSDAARASAYAANAIMGPRGAAVAAYSGMASQPSVGLLQGV